MATKNTLEPLQEVVAVATERAAVTLKILVGSEVTVTSPILRLVPIEKILTEVSDIAHVSSVLMVKIKGEAQGLLVFMLDPDEAQHIVGEIAQTQTNGTYNDKDHGILNEMANIVAGRLLGSIGNALGLKLMQSLPVRTTDILGAVLDPFIAELGTKFNQVLMQQETFTIPARTVRVNFIAIIDPPSTDRMLQKIVEKASSHRATNN